MLLNNKDIRAINVIVGWVFLFLTLKYVSHCSRVSIVDFELVKKLVFEVTYSNIQSDLHKQKINSSKSSRKTI